MIIKLNFSKETKIQFLKFVGAGIINTCVTLIVIYTCMKAGIDYRLSNLFGYILGVTCSFLLNKFWVFPHSNVRLGPQMLLFLTVFFFCYGIQYVILLVLAEMLEWDQYIAQFLAMAAYTLVNFLFNKMITFRRNKTIKADKYES